MNLKSKLSIGFLLLLGGCYVLGGREVPGVQKLPNLPKFGSFETLTAPEFEPVVILATDKNDGFCSGSVIDNNYILTAAHCLTNRYGYMTTKSIHILNDKGQDTKVVAKAAAINLRNDFAVVLGNFTNFNKLRANFYNLPFANQTVPYVACGFPHGQHRPLCILVPPPIPYDFSFLTAGILFPGMSGGPVLDLSLGFPVIQAVNTAVDGDTRPGTNIVLSPLTGLLGSFGIEPDSTEEKKE